MSRPERDAPGGLSHLDAEGRARMVDVGGKAASDRLCVARGEVRMAPATLDALREGRAPKGDVLATARIAGIQAAKRAHEWIPLAHPLPLGQVEVELALAPELPGVRLEARVRAHASTGVEMEALVAVSAAALTVYDMAKALDREMTLESVRLVEKQGGKSGLWSRPGEPGPAGARPGAAPDPGGEAGEGTESG